MGVWVSGLLSPILACFQGYVSATRDHRRRDRRLKKDDGNDRLLLRLELPN